MGNDALIPIVLGITGHRDLREQDIPRLKQHIAEIYKQVRKLCPHSPMLLLSSLQEGADRLAARVALEMDIDLVAVLPSPIEECIEGFESEESRKEFTELADRCIDVVHFKMGEGDNLGGSISEVDCRERQRQRAGAFVALHSHILIALWDGEESDIIGGTSEIVRYRLEGVPEPFAPATGLLEIPNNGPLYHVVTPRQSRVETKLEHFYVEPRYPELRYEEGDAEAHYNSLLTATDQFNQNAQQATDTLGKSIEKSKSFLVPEGMDNMLPLGSRKMLTVYSVADVLALEYQKKRWQVFFWVFVLFVTAVVVLRIYLGVLEKPYMLLLFALLLAAAYALYEIEKKLDFQRKHLDYRALAEGLRVQLFWRIAGLDDNVAEYYLRKHSGAFEWIRFVFSTLISREEPDDYVHDLSAQVQRYEFVVDHWVKDQSNYFNNVTLKNRKSLARMGPTANAFFWSAVVFVAIIFILDLFVPVSTQKANPALIDFMRVLKLMIAVAFVFGGIVKAYQEKKAYSEQEKQYARMYDLFSRAARQMEDNVTNKEFMKAEALLRELGKEALAENGDWVLMHRSRPITVPK